MLPSGYSRADDDYYIEPEWAVEALLREEKIYGTCYDPCCGSGNIPRILERCDYTCLGSDIRDRGWRNPGESEPWVVDFFKSTHLTNNIISNPPYSMIEDFIERGLEVATFKVIVLARLAFLEGQRRETFFKKHPLARVLVSRRRISMPPGGTDIQAKNGSIAYGWFIFEHGHDGPPRLGWF